MLKKRGELAIQATLDRGGRTYLSGQYACAPLAMTRPHWNAVENLAQLYIQHLGGGLLGGDELYLRLDLGEGSALACQSLSSLQLYPAETFATQEVEITLERGARLLYLPRPVTPHKGARYKSNTRIKLGRETNCIVAETFAPGRIAAGEKFVWAALDLGLTVESSDGSIIVAERACSDGPIPDVPGLFDPLRPYITTIYLLGSCYDEQPGLLDQLNRLLQDRQVWGGAGVLIEKGIVIRFTSREVEEADTFIHACLLMAKGVLSTSLFPHQWE